MIVTGNRKRVALITVHKIVDAVVSGVNSSKAQHERAIEMVTSARQIINKQLKELADCIERCARQI